MSEISEWYEGAANIDYIKTLPDTPGLNCLDKPNAKITILYKNKGERSDRNNYHDVTFQNVNGKVLARILLKRRWQVANQVYPESWWKLETQTSQWTKKWHHQQPRETQAKALDSNMALMKSRIIICDRRMPIINRTRVQNISYLLICTAMQQGPAQWL